MKVSNTPWGLKDILSPIILRVIIYGANQVDIENVLKKLESVKLLHARVLEENWWQCWDELGRKYQERGQNAKGTGHLITARNMFFYASSCYYAASLINYMDFEHKKHVFKLYSSAFQSFTGYADPPIRRYDLRLDARHTIPGYLYLPESTGPAPCMILLTGVGTSKEESHVFAAPLVERGIAVFTPDIPGIGEALFFQDQKFRWEPISRVLTTVLDFLQEQPEIDETRCGIYGICMAGPLGLKFAAVDPRIKLCTALFPHQIDMIKQSMVPLWMREGKWFEYFSGKLSADEFRTEMSVRESESIECPLFFIHSREDNWMSLDAVEKLAKKCKNKGEVLVIEEGSIFKSGIQVVHTIPASEQIHWVRHVMADWISDKFAEMQC